MNDSYQHVLPKKSLAKLLQVTIPGLRHWRNEGAPLDADLAGDPLRVIRWYCKERPCYSLQHGAARRLETYPSLFRRIQRERRKALKAAEAQKR